ncbi:MAG: hypothetical protein Q8S18_00025 [Bacteroidales bacterium]|nr:hypothetical protein [Bacteroidales bacterium]
MKKTDEILSKSVSVFPNVRDAKRTETTTVGDWIRGCMDHNNPNVELINEIRQTTCKDDISKLKLMLEGVTIGAHVRTREAGIPDQEKIISLSGALAFDIDDKHNPGMNPLQVREKLSNIRNVIFCGLSASGAGVWGIIEVAHPHLLRNHFEQLKQDFRLIGINLDPSKGGNPTDVRFYSYDPDAYLAEAYKVYERLPQPKPQQYMKPTNANGDGLKTAIRLIERAPDGQKHHILLKAARLAGGYVAAGTLSEHDALLQLEGAIRNKGNVISLANARKTISDGIAHGKLYPIQSAQTPAISTAIGATGACAGF